VVQQVVADIRKQSQGEDRPEADLQGKRVRAVFYRTEAGGEPVRGWLKSLPSREDRKRIGEDIKTVEFGWPVGMPVCRSVGGGIYEVRSDLAQTASLGYCFILTKVAEWCSCMGSSRRRGRRPTKI
jgi:putative component of toxin-antitoxin plasmid stabilization module